MKKIFFITLTAFIYSVLGGCCKQMVERKKLRIQFSDNHAPIDTVIIYYSQIFNNELEAEKIVIGEDRLIILTEPTNSNFSSIDTMIIEIKSKHIIDTLTHFTHSSRIEDHLGCASTQVELFSFKKDSVIHTPANTIRIDY